MASIQFGSLPAVSLNAYYGGAKVSAPIEAKPTSITYASVGSALVARNEAIVSKAFEKLNANLKKTMTRHDRSRVVKAGPRWRLKEFTEQQIEAYHNRQMKRLRIEAKFQQTEHMISRISIAGGVMPSTQQVGSCCLKRGKPQALSRRRAPLVHKRIVISDDTIQNLMNQVAKISMAKLMSIEIIGKRSKPLRVQAVRFNDGNYVRFPVKHLKGHKLNFDISLNAEQENLIAPFIRASNYKKDISLRQITYGSSGLAIGAHHVVKNIESQYMIVRGSFGNNLVDARSYVDNHTKLLMKYYSSVGDKFFNAFSEKFVEMREEQNHTCESNFDIREVGEVCAIVWQTLMPCGKITCRKCAQDYRMGQDSDENLKLAKRLERAQQVIKTTHKEFPHALEFLSTCKFPIRGLPSNDNEFQEIKRLLDEKKAAPFSHLNLINEKLLEMSLYSPQEAQAASKALLEVTRWHVKRKEGIESGSLAAFRNKVSAKSYFNMSLTCDNQRDQNGNFKWGERAYHAKRFFSNYFETIDPALGYSQYIVRLNPNGSRKLAIGNLIVTTNLSNFRNQMLGEPIEELPLTNSCISKLKGSFKYSCCCVTSDEGTPLYSEMKAPTKNHLVLGNAGDSKYVDLPTDTSLSLYIAKEGYCYVNIFLAMLVNVNEQDAKNFTKQVRDMAIAKLGKWPTLMDLATVCYQMTLFYPDTSDAELPRILVDHKHNMMHVVDSYGSLTTGYHTLKANTVSQLVQFANEQLESEMKFYQVGGKFEGIRVGGDAMKLLIKSIYRPELMREIIEEEPYLIVLSVCSPGVLLALANSGSLEVGIRRWIRDDAPVARMFAAIYTLAGKMTLARTLEEQLTFIRQSSPVLFEEVVHGCKLSASYKVALETITLIHEQNSTDTSLLEIGFRTLQDKSAAMLEKSYLRELEESWGELNLYGKYLAVKQAYKYRNVSSEFFNPAKQADLKGRYHISLRSCLTRTRDGFKNGVTRSVNYVGQGFFRMLTASLTFSLRRISKHLPEVFALMNVMLVLSLFVEILNKLQVFVLNHRQLKIESLERKGDDEWLELMSVHKLMKAKNGEDPTIEEFEEYIHNYHPRLVGVMKEALGDDVQHQGKKRIEEIQMERIIAFVSLVMMMFDAERSDCVYKILNKLKGLTNTIATDTVQHQSLDEYQTIDLEKNLTVDFELDTNDHIGTSPREHTFEQWWENQISRGNTIPHYRTEGKFMTFTRATAASVVNEIAHGVHKDVLLQGAVGSGKSTGFPFHLSKKGKVLLLEPTRPLAENVCKQLASEPFYTNATLRMRGASVFGSAPIHIMTTGFALHYLMNNQQLLNEYDYIIIDECHVLDANAMAFRCALVEYGFPGTIIKVSATPPGRETEFQTQHPVKLLIEENMSHDSFVNSLGTGANSDVTSRGDNILVYVASYNEVDSLSKKLIEKGHTVTKVDGRTMKMGSVEIATTGTPKKKHFIVATNIIENGVTLDVDVVVDFGTKVVPILDVDNRCVRYNKTCVSFGERIQRLGRVGRNKPGTALRIGATEKGLVEIPAKIATEAAFLCFSYGLPVMTNNVSTSLLANCTVRQARIMQQFELDPFYMINLVRYDGSMHPAIHDILKKFKLRDSETPLNTFAIPYSDVPRWLTVRDYRKVGISVNLDEGIRIPFYVKDVPERITQSVWEAVTNFKNDAQIKPLSSASAAKIAYTLKRDIHSIPRTLQILDGLIQSEMERREHYLALTANSCSGTNFSIMNVVNSIRSRFVTDHSADNIEKLSRARDQIREYKNLHTDVSALETLKAYGSLECVQHQSKDAISKHLKLKGIWNKSLMVRDTLVCAGVFVGGAWMLASWYFSKSGEIVEHQGYNKRQRQKLSFRNARDAKVGREVYADDNTMEHYFGEAYTKKGKNSGKTRGMGSKKRQFTTFYGCSPDDFSLIRYVDTLTGHTIDADPLEPAHRIQNQFFDQRMKLIGEDMLEPQHLDTDKAQHIEAYLQRKNTTNVLRADLRAHVPTLVCKNGNIAGYPERENEMRQTGALRMGVMPEKNEFQEFKHESKALFKGLRDYNPIASIICKLTNDSSEMRQTLYGIGYGGFIITVQHLFRQNNGTLFVQTRQGEFTVKNTTQLKMFPCLGRDVLVIQMPKEFPPFPRKLQFRSPIKNERVVMIGSNFQQKSTSSTISDSSPILPRENCHFWKHMISTKDGDCGLPMVSVTDGCIVGVHSMTSVTSTANYFTDFPESLKTEVLDSPEAVEWVKHWNYNVNTVCYGPMHIIESKPTGMFKPTKLVSDLMREMVAVQGAQTNWLYDQIEGNLKAIAHVPNQLVTKHVVKGKCTLFETYLATHPEEEKVFQPYLGAYAKSALNKAAYTKDVMKYSTTITVGTVSTDNFEKAVKSLIANMEEWGFDKCSYVTDEEAIFNNLNMKAAVGALYSGKKKDYFAEYNAQDKETIVTESCKRLYMGKMGVWNGALKAELRPIEKVQANKTRSFTAAPIDTLLGGKVCVDDFNNQFYSLHTKCPWSVGMTKFYGGWDSLLRSFPEGWVYCDADGSQFDSSLTPYIINAVLQVRLHFMEDWDLGEQMLKNLYTEIVYTPIATPDGTVIKKFKGNNSGQPSTVVDNTLMVIIALYYSLHELGYERSQFDHVCKFFVNGDDLIIAVNPSEVRMLDELQQLFKQLGLNYDFSSRTHDIKELWFMSHQGMEREGKLIPKLEIERIVSILEWDRSTEPEHRLEAICASMVEAWGYDWLIHEIRKFYSWVLEQFPYNELATQGRAPYIAETALRKLYLDVDATIEELEVYGDIFQWDEEDEETVYHQEDKDADKVMDAGIGIPPKDKGKNTETDSNKQLAASKDKDVNVGTSGTFSVPKLKGMASKMRLPKVRGKTVLNLDHLIQYNPEQTDLSNTRSTHNQFNNWYDGVKKDYELNDEQMEIIMNGLMVWCIENGCSPNINGMWVMMDGEEQIEYPIKPLIDHAKPTFRQIMAHFSDAAEAYIEKRNAEKAYMPRYGLQRNLNDPSLARYAFDFYEMTAKTPNRAREAHLQMKAAALRNASNKLFGIDGKVSSQEEDTERHTTDDVNRNMHSMLGVRTM
uniref:Genome polyprotein n=1 Tax=Carrot thin leaf virus TaxID=114922 RepID=A0A6H2MW51_9POTV|nr:Polyprotein [Carrot thin leaf virus]